MPFPVLSHPLVYLILCPPFTRSTKPLGGRGQWTATFQRVVLPLEKESEKLVRATWETVKATRSPAEIADSMYYNLVSARNRIPETAALGSRECAFDCRRCRFMFFQICNAEPSAPNL
eukprot:2033078-Rhodomonas_salina.1